MKLSGGLTDAIGNSPLVELQRTVPSGSARVFVKLEFENPTGSMKDRVAKAIVEAAASDGRLRPGGTVVEYTAGTTGVSLAMVCAAKGFRSHMVYSDAFSQEKRLTMEAFGSEVTIVKSDNKMITEKLIKEMIETAARISKKPNHWYSDQLSNKDAISGYYPLGEEIWNQAGGKIDAFVQAVGTAHSLHGATGALWKHKRSIHIAAVEPAESAVLSGESTGPNKIEGIGIGFIPPLWEPDLVNEIIKVRAEEAKEMSRRLARDEGLFVGTSSGANVVAALRVAKKLGPTSTVATIMVDSGLRYLSTGLFSHG